MLRVVVLVSGGGTNLQAVLDAVRDGKITNTEVAGVISNNKKAYALTRAEQAGIPAKCVSPKDFEDRARFNHALMEAVDAFQPDLIVLAGFLVATVHFGDEGTDTGPSILQKAVEVFPDDTSEVLQRRVMEQAEWQIMPEAVNLIANGKVSVKDGHVVIQK